MKSKKKNKKLNPKARTKKRKPKEDSGNKPMGQEIKKALENVLEQETAINKYAGSSFDLFMKGPMEFKDHLVHDGDECQWKEEALESQETKESPKSWVDYFFSIFKLNRK